MVNSMSHKVDRLHKSNSNAGTLWLQIGLCFSFISFYVNTLLFRTSLFPEVFVATGLILLAYRRNQFHHNRRIFLLLASFAVLGMCIFILTYLNGIVSARYEISKEVYRQLFVPILLFVVNSIQFDAAKIIRTVIILTVIAGFYTMAEVFAVNSIDGAAYLTAILYGQSFGVDDGFTLDKTIAIPFVEGVIYRPFGLFGQPQKSGIVFLIGIMFLILRRANLSAQRCCTYVCDTNKPNLGMITLFILFAIISTSKTALIGICLYLFVVEANRGKPGTIVYFIMAMVGLMYSIYVLLSHQAYAGPLLDDLNYLENVDLPRLLFGVGLLDDDKWPTIGMGGGEHFIIRLISAIGLIQFAALVFMLIVVLYEQSTHALTRHNLGLLVVFFVMTFHYSMLNVYFFMIALAIYYAILRRTNARIAFADK